MKQMSESQGQNNQLLLSVDYLYTPSHALSHAPFIVFIPNILVMKFKTSIKKD